MGKFSVYANNPTWSLINADLTREDVYNLVVSMYSQFPCDYIIKETDLEGELLDLYVVSSKARFEKFKEKYKPNNDKPLIKTKKMI